MKSAPAFIKRNPSSKIIVVAILLTSILSTIALVSHLNAAESAIDTQITTTTAAQKSKPQLVFTSATTGYMFYKDSGGNIAYSKTTDGGANWGSANNTTSQTDVVISSIWFDKWTPGGTGTVVHLVYVDTGNDDVWYDTFDTNGDTNGTEVAMDTTSGNTMTTADNATITKGTDGDLYIGFCDGTAACNVKKCAGTCTVAGNWVQAGAGTPLEIANDPIRLMPLSSGNILLVRDDISAEDIQSKVYNDASDTWDGSWANIDTDAADSTTYLETIATTVDTTTNDIYLAYGAAVGGASTADIRTAVYNGSWTAGADVVTNVNTMIALDIAYYQASDEVYVSYLQGTAGSNTSVYYKSSDDGMASWNEGPQLNTITGDIRYIYSNMNSSDIIYTAYYRNTGTDDDLYGNQIDATMKPPESPITPYANDVEAQTGQVTPVSAIYSGTPKFSAIYDDINTSNTAVYYQLQIGTDTSWTAAETWDSGKTALTSCNEGTRCSDITYGGANILVSGTTYYWRLKFWDNEGMGGDWSDNQQFTMYAGGGEAVIDTAATTTAGNQKSKPQLVFTSSSVGYMFYKDSGGNIAYSKTTDGGANWGSANNTTAQTDVIISSIWFDKWTPGNSGTVVHLVYIDTGNDDVWYDTLDTNGDTQGTEVAMNTTAGNTIAVTDNATISRGTDGDLYIGFCDGSAANACNVKKCTGSCTVAGNWVQAGAASPLEVANDYIRLMPLASGNMLMIRDDISAEDIQSKVYTDSSNTWDANWTNIDTDAADSTTYLETLTATVDTSTNDIYLAYGATVAGASTADIRTAVYNGSWTSTSNVVTDVNTMIALDIVYDQLNGYVYVVYLQGTAGSNTTVYYKKSTDDMSSWSGGVKLSTITGDIRYVYGNMNSSNIIYAAYYRNTGTNDDIYGNTIDIPAKSPLYPQTPYVNNTTAQSGQASPASRLTDSTPAFSAIFNDYNVADTSSNYEIEVGTDTDWASAEKWDSGKTSMSSCNEGARCGDITYAGSSLSAGTSYYWRIRFWDNGDLQGAWSETQQFTMNYNPTVTSVTLNGGSNIALSDGTTTNVTWTATVTDTDGNDDIASANGKLYRSGVTDAQNCTVNNQNCYSDAVCDLSGCSGSSCTATCTIPVHFFADSTDTNGTYPSEYWLGWVSASDDGAASANAFSPNNVTDIESLIALSTGSTLDFGVLYAGEDTGSDNTISIVYNTGNRTIDAELSGTDMCNDYPTCADDIIPVENIEYSDGVFSYGDGVDLTDIDTEIQLDIIKSTTSPSTQSVDIYWGISLPSIIDTGTYNTEVSIVAIPD